jgi:exportin-1
MLFLVNSNRVHAPLFDGVADNIMGAKNHIAALLMSAFPNLTRTQVVTFVMGLFDESMDLVAFKQHMRDFLIQIKEFSAEDNAELFLEETEATHENRQRQIWQYKVNVPGLLAPGEGSAAQSLLGGRAHDDDSD